MASSYVDPSTDITGGAETGREPLAKTASYYRRSWSTGSPFSSEPAWKDLAHAPPSRRELIARPDLALVAMRRILGRVEGELAHEAAIREHQRLQREDRLIQIRARHSSRHEAQMKIGVVPPRHVYNTVLKQRRRLNGSSSASSFRRFEGDEGGDDLEEELPDMGGGVRAQLARPSSCGGLSVELPGGADPSDRVAASAAEEDMAVRCASPSARSAASGGGATSPIAAMRSQHYAGLEGLLIPRYSATASPMPAEGLTANQSTASFSCSPSRTPAPLSSPTRNGPAMLIGSADQLKGADFGTAEAHPTEDSGHAMLPTASRLVGAPTRDATSRSFSRSLASPTLASSIVAPVRVRTVSSSIASANSGSRKSAPPLLGWAEPHGQSLGKAPRRMPSHFEMGLARHDQCPNPCPSFKPSRAGVILNQPKADVNLRSNTIGDGSQAYMLTPAISSQAEPQPQRWNSAQTLTPIQARPKSAMQPPSPSSLARAARALNGGW